MKKTILICLFGLLISSLTSCSNKIHVTFDANGGVFNNESSIIAIECKSGTKLSAPEAPSRNGYEIVKTNDEVDWYCGAEKWSFIGYTVDRDMTLKCKWDPIRYHISYDLNGGICTNNPSYYTCEDEFHFHDAYLEGYSFVGWVNDNNQKIEKIEKGNIGNLHLKAIFTPNSYNLIVDFDDACGSVFYDKSNLVDSSVTVIAQPNPGYSFKCWKLNDSFIMSTNLNYTFSMPAHDIYLTAEFTKNTYLIVYNLDGGLNNDKNINSYSVTDSFVFFEPTKEGYSFLGWYDISGNLIEKIDFGSTGNLELFAHWLVKSYRLKIFSEDILKGSVSNVDGEYNFGTSILLSAKPSAGYFFKGWSIDSQFISFEENYFFTIPSRNCLIKANFWTMAEKTEYEISNGITPTKENNEIKFGIYPQSLVKDSDTVKKLNSLDSRFLINNLFNLDFGFYSKREFNDESCSVSWFKCEPIIWKIRKTTDDSYALISKKFLEYSRFFDGEEGLEDLGTEKVLTDYRGETSIAKTNDYKYSVMRTFLNTDFLNSSFLNTNFLNLHEFGYKTNSEQKTDFIVNDFVGQEAFYSDSLTEYTITPPDKDSLLTEELSGYTLATFPRPYSYEEGVKVVPFRDGKPIGGSCAYCESWLLLSPSIYMKISSLN